MLPEWPLQGMPVPGSDLVEPVPGCPGQKCWVFAAASQQRRLIAAAACCSVTAPPGLAPGAAARRTQTCRSGEQSFPCRSWGCRRFCDAGRRGNVGMIWVPPGGQRHTHPPCLFFDQQIRRNYSCQLLIGKTGFITILPRESSCEN